MRRRQQNMFLFSLCCAACALVLLASMRTAEALSLVYAHNFGTAYADTLRRASSEPLDAQGLSTNLLEIFQDHRADAVELYDFQAEQFVRGSTEQLYWYPHFSAVVVLAVAEDCPVPVEGWNDLRENVTVVLPDSCPDRMAKESRFREILARQEVRRQNGLRHIVEERLVMRGKTDAHGSLIHRSDLAHILEIRAL